MTLKPEDHALITRLMARQPNLMLRGHEGYYRHEDIIEAIQLIGRLAAAREDGRAPASGDLRERLLSVDAALAYAENDANAESDMSDDMWAKVNVSALRRDVDAILAMIAASPPPPVTP